VRYVRWDIGLQLVVRSVCGDQAKLSIPRAFMSI
jgi:hypothetical protein